MIWQDRTFPQSFIQGSPAGISRSTKLTTFDTWHHSGRHHTRRNASCWRKSVQLPILGKGKQVIEMSALFVHWGLYDPVCDPICSGKPSSNPVSKNHTPHSWCGSATLPSSVWDLSYTLYFFVQPKLVINIGLNICDKKYLYLNCRTCLQTSPGNCPVSYLWTWYIYRIMICHMCMCMWLYLTKLYSVHNANAFSESWASKWLSAGQTPD